MSGKERKPPMNADEEDERRSAELNAIFQLGLGILVSLGRFAAHKKPPLSGRAGPSCRTRCIGVYRRISAFIGGFFPFLLTRR
jgi:hypothetical protein